MQLHKPDPDSSYCPSTKHAVASKQAYAAALGISSIIFLWDIQVKIGSIGVPIYFIASLFFIHTSKFLRSDVMRFIIGTVLLFFILGLQLAMGAVLTTPLRSFVSVFFISFIVVCVYRWLSITIRFGALPLFKVLRWFLIAQFVVMLCQLFAWSLGMYSSSYANLFNIPRVSGLFSEPSHVALSLSPFIYLFFCYRKLAGKWLGKSGLLCLLSIFVLCPSTTMLGIVGLAMLFKQWKSLKSIKAFAKSTFIFLTVASILGSAIIYVPPIHMRVMGLSDVVTGHAEIDSSINISALVYIKGAEMAWAALKHFPFGVGLLNMQELNDYSAASSVSETLNILNADDGGSIAFKLIGEFGYIGLLMVILMAAICAHSVRSDQFNDILFGFFMFGIIATFLRGASYFDGVPIIAFAVLFMKVRLLLIGKPHKRYMEYNMIQRSRLHIYQKYNHA